MQTYKIQEMRTNQIEGLLGTPDSVFTNITLLGKSVATNAEADGLIYWKYYLHCDWTGDELYLNFKINTNGNVIAVYSDD